MKRKLAFILLTLMLLAIIAVCAPAPTPAPTAAPPTSAQVVTTTSPARAVAVLYSNYTHIVASDDAGIKMVADMKGKRVSVAAPGSGTKIIAS